MLIVLISVEWFGVKEKSPCIYFILWYLIMDKIIIIKYKTYYVLRR
jgi:hypothetical protein